MQLKKKTAIAAAATAAVVGTGIGVAQFASADPSTTPSPSGTTAARPDQNGGGKGRMGGHRGGGFIGADTKALAEKLGVTEAKLTKALEEIRAENKDAKPTARPSTGTRPDPAARQAAFAKALAAKLGISETTVTKALTELRAEHQADEKAAFKAKLDAAVKAGTLSQAEADAVMKAAEKGVIGMHGGPGDR